MKASIEQKLNQIQERYEELGALLSDADVIADQTQFRSYSQAVSYTHLTLPTILLV